MQLIGNRLPEIPQPMPKHLPILLVPQNREASLLQFPLNDLPSADFPLLVNWRLATGVDLDVGDGRQGGSGRFGVGCVFGGRQVFEHGAGFRSSGIQEVREDRVEAGQFW